MNPAAPLRLDTPPLVAAGKLHFEVKDAAGAVLLAHDENTWNAATAKEVRLGPPSKENRDRRSRDEDYVTAGGNAELKRFYDDAAAEYLAGLGRFSKSPVLRKASGRLAFHLGEIQGCGTLLVHRRVAGA